MHQNILFVKSFAPQGTKTPVQRIKKVTDFFAHCTNATFFVKRMLHEKSRYARQKV